MMKSIMLSCKEATFLLAKKEEGKLSGTEGLKLGFHLFLCKFCRMFEKQTKKIARESRHIHSVESLSSETKQRIDKTIKEQYR